MSIREHTTEEGYLESYGIGYAIVFGLMILFLNGLLGILLEFIGMAPRKSREDAGGASMQSSCT